VRTGQQAHHLEEQSDDKHIAMRWNKRIHRLTRVDTTTGANRFENHKMGLVWIGIPAKGLLLDSKKGRSWPTNARTPNNAGRRDSERAGGCRGTTELTGIPAFPVQRRTESGSTPQFTIAAQTGFDS
jgi:hypothetical protein